ncbi:ubiquitin carboxyl-terminal hydrolase 48-like [Saccostrea echinata]|uniref:ubiquitin carboxyl-terminal hydrolase 48-like n=1 Tax=Saccostrea echinata TaxID=191078 RepID=UPI002A7F3EC3|nr:ubiquitin carboxyl-terminal hydrolase 48-like [Saccostrea echinata]
MPTKQQLDKAAWQWAETTDPIDITNEHIRTAYKLNLKPCKLGACKRNCKGNPFCINCIGERKWFGEINDDSWHDIEDPNNERRQGQDFVGLKNLGNTCYVNTFLQLWFHSPPIRQALYKFRETDMIDKVGDEWKPNSIGGHLQAIFSLLELSERAYISPQDFIDHLGLDAALQQDAQEFSKLFLSLLEDCLSQQQDPTVRNIIQDQLCGEYAYVTTCSGCHNSSQTHSKFYELDLHIQGHKTLEDSITDFLHEEKLEGDNQYMCSTCCRKQNAKRAIQLKRLPPILNLQLLRFVFDKKTGHKKKLNGFIQFPETLDMSKFMNSNGNLTCENSSAKDGCIYKLKAVLIHRGPSAYSGHYIAHILDESSGVWYKFNDEETTKMKGSNLHLGTEEDLQETSAKQKGKVPKGYHSSRNAYMVVYTRDVPPEEKDKTIDMKIPDKSYLPEYMSDYVKKDNEKFEMWVAELLMMREQNIETGKKKQEDIRQTFSQLVVGEEDQESHNYEWISLPWLTHWLEDPGKARSVDNEASLCQHGKLHPDKAGKMKCVQYDAVDGLYEKYKGGPRLPGDKATCLICVQSRCKVIRTKRKMVEDEKLFSTMKKVEVSPNEPAFWVGKSSLRSWKRLVLEQLEDFREDRESIEQGTDNGVDQQEQPSGTTEIAADKSMEVPEDANDFDEKRKSTELDNGDNTVDKADISVTNESMESSLQFNEDLLCEFHGQLDPDPSCRKLIPADLWNRLKEYFPDCPEFPSSHEVCQKCCDKNKEETENQNMNKKLAQVQKADLADLFNDRKRPVRLVTGEEIFVVNAQFVEDWRHFVKDPSKFEPVSEVKNTRLLCEHRKYLYPPPQNGADLSDNTEVIYLWPSEFEKVMEHFVVDYEVSVVKYEEEDGSDHVITLPEVCEECVKERENMIEMAKYVYRDATVFVRKAVKDKQGDTSTENSKQDYPDPDFCTNDRRKSECDEPPEKLQKMDGNAVRKSQRHRKVRGEKELKVSSDQTLRDLKLQLMKLFSVPPFDQNLSIAGVPIKDDKATLGSLRVAPGDIIMLQADEPVEDPGVLQDLMNVSGVPEAGFKGTGLLGKLN